MIKFKPIPLPENILSLKDLVQCNIHVTIDGILFDSRDLYLHISDHAKKIKKLTKYLYFRIKK